jgi:hypothetical protein
VSASRARLLLVGALLVILPVAAPIDPSPAIPGEISAGQWVETRTTRELRAKALRLKRIARHWRALMNDPRPTLRRPSTPFASLFAKRTWMVRGWKAHVLRARELAERPPHRAEWRCIHRYEGPWNDPGAPYYGGLQMDLTFQRMYGRRLLRRDGTANRWSPLEQMWVAERAIRAGRGFHPWPVSARLCGLI